MTDYRRYEYEPIATNSILDDDVESITSQVIDIDENLNIIDTTAHVTHTFDKIFTILLVFLVFLPIVAFIITIILNHYT